MEDSASSTPTQKHPSNPLIVREMELEDLPKVFALGERLFTAEKWPNLYRTWDEYEVIELFAHIPGTSVSWDVVEHVFAGARDRCDGRHAVDRDCLNGTAQQPIDPA